MAWLLWAYIACLAVLRIIALKIMTPRSKAGPALSRLTGRLTPSFVLRIIDIALGGALLLAPLVIPISTAAAGAQGALVDTRTEHHSPPQSSTYLVRPGDSLWQIAEQQLGSAPIPRRPNSVGTPTHSPQLAAVASGRRGGRHPDG
jgi:hypothetical protein